MAYQNIVVVGPGGKIGNPLVKALLASTKPKFNVTALIRPSSSYIGPEGIDKSETTNLAIVKADLDDHDSLVKVFKEQQTEAIVLTIGGTPELEKSSKNIIGAAIDAGVKWVMPSDFGHVDSPVLDNLFRTKTEVLRHIQEKANEGKVNYNVTRNGPWFDITMEVTIGFNLKERKVALYEGNKKFHTTTVASVCTAILNILRNPSKFANRILYIHDFFITQTELLSTFESVIQSQSQSGPVDDANARFTIEKVNIDEVGQKALDELKQGGFNKKNILDVVKWNIWGEGGATQWDENDDSASLGIGGVNLVEEAKKLIEATAAH